MSESTEYGFNQFALSASDVPEDPNMIPNDTYSCVISAVKIGPTQKKDKIGVTFRYKIQDGPYQGREISEWKEAALMEGGEVKPSTPQTRGYLRQRLIGLGVPPDRLDVVEPEDLIDKEVVVELVNRNGYANAKSVTLANLDDSTTTADGKGMFNL